MGMNRKTAHSYAKEFQGKYGQVRDVIIVEATWLGYFEPYTTKTVSSLIYEMMQSSEQTEIAKETSILPFDVLVLKPERTICEKIMSLVRFSYTENPIDDLKKKIRHIYDLHQLLNDGELQKFFQSNEFNKMLIKVANDDVLSFKNNNYWLEIHPAKSMMFAKTDTLWNELRKIYNNDFRSLVYGHFPNENDILKTLQNIAKRLVTVGWTLKI